MKKESRPDIPKLEITNIGSFDSEGKPIYWAFNGKSHPHSVGIYYSDDWYLIGGYTADELRDIKKGAEMTDKTDIELKIVFVRWEQEGAKLGSPLSDAVNDVKKLCIESDKAREYWEKHTVDQACDEAVSLATFMWEEYYKEVAPEWEPLDNVSGVISQIDNMVAGLPQHFIEQACEAIDYHFSVKNYPFAGAAQQAIRDRFKPSED